MSLRKNLVAIVLSGSAGLLIGNYVRLFDLTGLRPKLTTLENTHEHTGGTFDFISQHLIHDQKYMSPPSYRRILFFKEGGSYEDALKGLQDILQASSLKDGELILREIINVYELIGKKDEEKNIEYVIALRQEMARILKGKDYDALHIAALVTHSGSNNPKPRMVNLDDLTAHQLDGRYDEATLFIENSLIFCSLEDGNSLLSRMRSMYEKLGDTKGVSEVDAALEIRKAAAKLLTDFSPFPYVREGGFTRITG